MDWPAGHSQQRRAVLIVAALLVAAVTVAFVIRLPSAFTKFDDRATLNNSQSEIGRAIAGADAEEIDNEFLVQALTLLPRNASYTILRPPSLKVAATYGISSATFYALYGFALNALLPRRQVAPAEARYMLCYACNTDPFDARMKRLWQNDKGLVIGELTR
jgi:hypothetical protein